MSRKTLIVLACVLILALELVGISYGSWREDLTMQGETETGTLDLYFQNLSTTQWFTGPDLTVYTEADWPEKFVPVTCSAQFIPGGGLPNPDLDDSLTGYDTGDDWLQVTVTGAYPGYYCEVQFDIHNGGTVPAELHFAPDPIHNADALIERFECAGTPIAGALYQIHEGESVHCDLLVHFGSEDSSIGENQEFYLSYTIKSDQWNEPDAR
ncbi:MAG: hypothetical protein Kow00124_31940 [Anaerolineae bacterium]